MKSKQFPFAINKFYNKEEIWRGLEVGARGGIRVNKEKNFVVVFSDVKSDRISMADYTFVIFILGKILDPGSQILNNRESASEKEGGSSFCFEVLNYRDSGYKL